MPDVLCYLAHKRGRSHNEKHFHRSIFYKIRKFSELEVETDDYFN